jgi:hypothetical protein
VKIKFLLQGNIYTNKNFHNVHLTFNVQPCNFVMLKKNVNILLKHFIIQISIFLTNIIIQFCNDYLPYLRQ